METRFTYRRILLLLVILALAKSLILALIITPSYGPDGSSYLRYMDAYENPESADERWYIRGTTPIYPLFAYAMFKIGGVYFIAGIQIVLGALFPAALYAALYPIDKRAALIAGILTALDPQTGLFYELVATEGLYIALLGLGTAAFFLAVQRPHWFWQVFAVGLLLGLGAFTRPVGTLLIVPAVFFFLLMTRSLSRTVLLAAGYITVYLALSLFHLWRFDFFAASSANGFYLATRLFSVGDVYSQENGAASERLYRLARDCDLELTGTKDENLETTQELRLCLIYTHQLSLEEISNLYQEVYSEAVRAKPLIFGKTMLSQGIDFVGMLSAPYDRENMEGLMTDCDSEPVFDSRWEAQDIFCPAPPRPLAFLTSLLYAGMLGFSFFTTAFHFLLAGMTFPQNRPVVRWLLLYCLAMYAYHVVITAAAGTILPRYVTVTNFYVLIVFAFVSVAFYDNWQRVRHSLKSD